VGGGGRNRGLRPRKNVLKSDPEVKPEWRGDSERKETPRAHERKRRGSSQKAETCGSEKKK